MVSSAELLVPIQAVPMPTVVTSTPVFPSRWRGSTAPSVTLPRYLVGGIWHTTEPPFRGAARRTQAFRTGVARMWATRLRPANLDCVQPPHQPPEGAEGIEVNDAATNSGGG